MRDLHSAQHIEAVNIENAGVEPASVDMRSVGRHDGSGRNGAANPRAAAIENFLQLPEVPVQPRRRRSLEEPLVDYSKSILLTSETYMEAMELKAERKEKARKEAELRKAESERKKEARALEKQRKEVEKIQRVNDARAKEAFAQNWTTKAIREAGERLQWLVKNAPPLPPGCEEGRFYGVLPQVCKENMSRRLAKRRAKKNGVGTVCEVPPPTAPAWVHRCDPRFQVELTEPSPEARS